MKAQFEFELFKVMYETRKEFNFLNLVLRKSGTKELCEFKIEFNR